MLSVASHNKNIQTLHIRRFTFLQITLHLIHILERLRIVEL